MIIELTQTEFDFVAKYMRPERLYELILNNHYKINRHYVDEVIVNCPSVTKEMVKNLFSDSFPNETESLEMLLNKCTVSELTNGLVEQAKNSGVCWGEPVNGDNISQQVILKVLLRVSDLHSYNPEKIIKPLITAEMVSEECLQQ